MKLIVGLGNPGKIYENTRHNIGFILIDAIAQQYNIKITKNKFNGLYEKININEEKIILLKPQKYINLSGEVIRDFVNFYKIDLSDILIISDDLDMPFGKIKIKSKGSSGGHNGLKNIELNLKTQNYKRIKVGISNNKNIDTKDYVLGKLNKEEEKILNNIIKLIPDIFNDYLNLSFDMLMSKYNKKN